MDAPLALYRDGRSDEAREAAGLRLEGDPEAADAHLCLGLIAMRANDTPAMLASLKTAARLRSGGWLLARLREDFAVLGAPSLKRPDELGGLLRAQLSPLGPALAPEARRADHEFINVVGSSYVRSFGASNALFPLFIGMGPHMLLLTEAATALTRRKVIANLRRIDSARDTLLVLGGDAFYHERNVLQTRTHAGDAPLAADRALMRTVAERHGAILAEARAMLSGRLFLLACTPTHSGFVDDLARGLNRDLAEVCAANGAELIDLWDDLADPVTGRLRADYAANAYAGDIHYSLAATPLVLDALKARGVLSAAVPSAMDFDWTSVFDCQVEGERTRIWCEPNVTPHNAFTDKIAYTHLSGMVANLVTYMLAAAEGGRLAMINVRDAGPCVLVPPQVQAGGLAITDSEANRRAGQMALDFYGRDDLRLFDFGPRALAAAAGDAASHAVLLIHPGSEAADAARGNAVLAGLEGLGRVIIGTPDPTRLGELALGGRRVSAPIPVANRHVPEKWRNYSIVVAS